jgi:hypothetical protein
MVKTISGMLGTSDLTAWEEKFITSVMQRSEQGKDTSKLTEGQVQAVESIYQKHFA